MCLCVHVTVYVHHHHHHHPRCDDPLLISPSVYIIWLYGFHLVWMLLGSFHKAGTTLTGHSLHNNLCSVCVCVGESFKAGTLRLTERRKMEKYILYVR